MEFLKSRYGSNRRQKAEGRRQKAESGRQKQKAAGS
jgi:hypothetical protein